MLNTQPASDKVVEAEVLNRREVRMFVCPDCKGKLDDLRCVSCGQQYARKDGFPVLLSQEPELKSAGEIGDTYDDIYTNRSGVWEDQGRTPEFIAYFSGMLNKLSSDDVLEIGCGEGFLLSALTAKNKVAVDLSSRALRKATERTQADFTVALAERLPLPSNSFNLVTSVGVMEHFLHDRDATREVLRVLKSGGHYVALIHVDTTVSERVQQKFREYFFPRPHPIALVKYFASKIIKPISQPIQRRYTVASGQACLQESGFTIAETISTRTHVDVPLVGPHVVIYVAKKLESKS
jgi:ubiquinone/menaquinone biosynthesis C-methylase UbiE/uncharacterized protein YbaR (Trm112 family)